MATFLKKHHRLIVLGIAGLVVFLVLLDQFYPFKAVDVGLSRSQAIAVAEAFLVERGLHPDDYHVMTTMGYDDEAFIYLQQKFGFHAAQDMVRYKSNHGFDFSWKVLWYKNLPKSAPQERFSVDISGLGDIVGFLHEVPSTFDWPRTGRAHLSQDEAFEIAVRFLETYEVNLTDFQRDLFSSQRREKRTDHLFRWKKTSDFDDSFVEMIVIIQGDELGQFQIQYQIPEHASTGIKRQSGIEYFFDNVISVTILFFIGLIALFTFLKKYHEGEVEVRTATIVFTVLIAAFVLEAIQRFRLNASGFEIGDLSPDGIGLFFFILLVLIIRPIVSFFGFAAWSVGESFGREQHGKAFAPIDGMVNGHFFTLDYARSTLQGLCCGFISLGLIAVCFWISLRFLGCTTRISGYQNVCPLFLSPMSPLLTAISGSLLGEMVFRLFGNLFVHRHLHLKFLAVILTAVFWAFYAPGFWGIRISLFPVEFELIVWFLIGLLYGFLFWKYDLLTVIFASFVTIGVVQTLPLITSTSDVLVWEGWITFGLMFLTLIPMGIGFLKKDTFSFHTDSIPAHIRRITERVRMTKELEIAKQVQMKLLPKKNPLVPGFEISGRCLPAQETGGDYFDFIDLGPSRLGIVIGDVSGKGVPAAIYMTLTKGMVQSHSESFLSPREVMMKVNRLLYQTIDGASFVSLFYAILDHSKRTVIYSRAGHNPAIWFKESGGNCQYLEPDGIALGLDSGVTFNRVIEERKIIMQKGDLLVFYTDGFTEAMNWKKEEYGELRLAKIVGEHHDKPVDLIHDAVMSDVRKFVKDAPQHDDMTMVFIRGI